jgi:hypothetical protein
VKRIWWFIKDCIVGIKNVFIWLPVIWHDRQWDYFYLLEVLRKKLLLMENYYLKDHDLSFKGQDKVYDQIKLCKILCNRLIKNEYENNAMIPYYKKYNQNVWTFEAETKQQKDEYTKYIKHADYMGKQDIKMLFNTINKNITNWWL